MSTQATAATPTINLNDPRLHTEHLDPAPWQPPHPWPEAGLTHDERRWIDAMAALRLPPKATAAFTCGAYYNPLLTYSDHYIQLGRATCQCETCRDCGTGKMRAHRMYRANPARYAIITSEDCRTVRLVVHYEEPAATLDAYITRVLSHRRHLSSLRRKMRRDFGQHEHGYTACTEFDPRRRDVIFRLYYVGYDPHHGWFRSEWQRIIGLAATCESKAWSADRSKDALRWTLDSILPILMLPGAERAAWEKAMQGNRFTSSVGCLRGVDTGEVAEKEKDSEAPHGYCPCGCGGALTKPDGHDPNTLEHFQSSYKIVGFGPIKTYDAYRSKVNRAGFDEHRIPSEISASSHAPPS